MSRYFIIKTVIHKCNECPHFYVENHGYAGDYICAKLNKKLRTYVEWKEDVEVPEECPLFKKFEEDRRREKRY